MKKLLLLNFLLIVVLFPGLKKATAQYINVLDARLIVDEPAAISGVKLFTYSSDPDGTGPWGRALDSTWIHVEVVKAATDITACTALDPNAMQDKWVLIQRGNCEFGFKALKAQQAGAKGVIIYNHTPDELVNMAAGASGGSVTIPVLFVTKQDGEAMVAQLNASNRLYISLTRWGFGYGNDITMVPASAALPPAGALPKHQLDGSDVPAYRVYTGAYVANTGTNDQTHVKFTQEAKFTPTGGSASVVFNDTTNVDTTFAVGDSIVQLFSANEFKLAPGGTGRYDFSYSVLSDSTDEYPSDNVASSYMEVTSNVFCKGRFDVNTQKAIATNYYRLSNGTELTFGPLFFNHVGDYQFQSVSFSVADQDTSDHTLDGINNDLVDVYLFKWVDANANRYMESSELELKSIAVHEFTTQDSNRTYINAQFGNTSTGDPTTVISENDTWYWVAVNLSSVFGLGCDGTLSYFNRANAAQNFATNKRDDFWGPAYSGSVATLRGSTGDTVRLMPFNVTPANSNNTDSTSFRNQYGTVPAVAVYTSVFPVKVDNKAEVKNNISVYPNPASGNVNIRFDLDKPAEKVVFKVIDAFGRNVYVERLNNVQQKEISVSTASYPAGNYYAVVIVGETAVSKPFTIVK